MEAALLRALEQKHSTVSSVAPKEAAKPSAGFKDSFYMDLD